MSRKPTNYDSEAGRFLEADLDVTPIIMGIEDYDRALSWHQEAIKHDASKDVKEQIAEKLKELG